MTFGTHKEGDRQFGVFAFSNGSQLVMNEPQLFEFQKWLHVRIHDAIEGAKP